MILYKLEENAPSTKAENNIARISNLLVKSTIFDETLRFKGVSIGIDFLVTGHAPVNAIRVSTGILGGREGADHKLAYTIDFPGTRYLL